MNRFNKKKSKFRKNLIPKGLKFLTKELKINPKVVKAIVRPFSESLQSEFDAKLLEWVAQFPALDETKPETMPTVRAVSVDERNIEITEWLNKVYSGSLFPENDLIIREPLINPDMKIANHILWKKVSKILIAEVKFVIKSKG